ncbi:MAG: DoxX family protein [Verrucomicrobia bacterium]|nr:DoxX family protein [Verrucomicrobiota bacterium]MBV9672910.1 DoxX family protein [Verrucomicrobiota bacterium]
MDTSSQADPTRSSSTDAALLLLRIACGLVFIYHGSAILFGAFDGPGPEKFAAGMHAPVLIGYLVGLAQFGGGLAVLTGILIRLGALCIVVVMFGAIFLVHLQHGFEVAKGGIEFALTMLLIAFALFLTGAGSYSLAGQLPESMRKL